ncbi:hypothetical protein IIV6-T1_236 [Invertebrate iridescent virus 6]|nr:hypothetical protein IIV6-T1_236 [Invertebrate iridescent virus 6]
MELKLTDLAFTALPNGKVLPPGILSSSSNCKKCGLRCDNGLPYCFNCQFKCQVCGSYDNLLIKNNSTETLCKYVNPKDHVYKFATNRSAYKMKYKLCSKCKDYVLCAMCLTFNQNAFAKEIWSYEKPLFVMEICKKCMHKHTCDECNTPSSSNIKIFLDGYIYCNKCDEE